jgi:hypothetical protein
VTALNERLITTVGGDIWESSDGVSWVELATDSPWTSFNQPRVVMGGTLYVADANNQCIWSTDDGMDWVQAGTDLTFLENRSSFILFVFGGKLAIASGYDTTLGSTSWSAGYAAIMVSDDRGASWVSGLNLPSSGAPFIKAQHYRIAGKDYFFLKTYSNYLGYVATLYRYDVENGWALVPGYDGDDSSGALFLGELIKLNADGTIRYSGNRLRGLGGDGVPGFARPAHLAAGSGFSLAIARDGTLWAWGGNSNGQLGLGDTESRNRPTQVGVASNWVQVVAGSDHTAALDADGNLYTWGWNRYGQLGLGDTDNRLEPTLVEPAEQWQAVSCGSYHTLAQRTDNTLWTWGNNYGYPTYDGVLGLANPTQATYSTPQSPALLPGFEMIAAGKFDATDKYNLATTTDGRTMMWGYRRPPYEFVGSPQYYGNWIGAVASHSAGSSWFLTTAGSIFDAWRENQAPLDHWISISGDDVRLAAIRSDNTLWRRNVEGGMDQIGADSDWVAVVRSSRDYNDFYLVQKADGSLWSFGQGGSNFGDESDDVRTVTVPIPVLPFAKDGVVDSDGDSLPDWYERRYASLDPEDPNDALGDFDGDGLNAAAEFQHGTDPEKYDTDGDRLADGWEVGVSGDPLVPLQTYNGSMTLQGVWRPDGLEPDDPIGIMFGYDSVSRRLYGYDRDTGFGKVYATIDLSDLIEIGEWDTRYVGDSSSGMYHGSAVQPMGQYLVVAGGFSGLFVYDMSNPGVMPEVLMQYEPSCSDLAAQGDVLISGDNHYNRSEISVYRFKVDGTVEALSTISTGHYPGSFDFTGSRLAFGLESGGITVWDLSDPAQPVSLASWVEPNYSSGVIGQFGDDIVAVGVLNGKPVALKFELEGAALTLVSQTAVPGGWKSFERQQYTDDWFVCKAGNGFQAFQVSVDHSLMPLPPVGAGEFGVGLEGDRVIFSTPSGIHQYLLETSDSDGDQLDDDWELQFWGDLSHSGHEDVDGDDLTNLEEMWIGSSPVLRDSDGDMDSDGDEVAQGRMPLHWDMRSDIDTDGDDLPDRWEFDHFGDLQQNGDGDFDGDGSKNALEWLFLRDPNTPNAGGDLRLEMPHAGYLRIIIPATASDEAHVTASENLREWGMLEQAMIEAAGSNGETSVLIPFDKKAQFFRVFVPTGD